MSESNPGIYWDNIIVCDPEPDSRQRLAEKIAHLGYKAIPTGNTQIVSTLVNERPLGALIVSVSKLRLSMLTTIVEVRRNRPELPIIMIFNEAGGSIPPGLASAIAVCPNDRTLRHMLHEQVDVRAPMAVAS